MPADQIRNRTVGCKMTDSEYERLSAVVESEGMTLGEWCRETLLASVNGEGEKSADLSTASGGTGQQALMAELVALRRQEWIAGIALEHGVVTVEVGEAPVEHNVKLQDFNKWVRKDGGSPRDVAQRGRVREILGLNSKR